MTLSEFDYPYTLKRVAVTEGATNQSTGVFTAGSEAITTITGHLQEITAKELQRLPEGEYEIGDKKLFTPSDIDEGDTIRITAADTTTTDWTVRAIENNYHLLSKYGIQRHSYHLKQLST